MSQLGPRENCDSSIMAGSLAVSGAMSLLSLFTVNNARRALGNGGRERSALRCGSPGRIQRRL